jgi:tetratricopeptide (TPR) repeat protein
MSDIRPRARVWALLSMVAALQFALPSLALSQTPNDVWASAARVQDRKQEFVVLLRQLVVALTGTFGDEGERARTLIGSLDAALTRWDQAIEAQAADATRRSADVETHIALGTVYLERHRAAESLREFEAAGRIAPDRPDIPGYMALAHGLAGDLAASLPSLVRTVEREPRSPMALYELARAQQRTGHVADSAETLRSYAAAASARSNDSSANGAALQFQRVALLREAAGVSPILPLALYRPGFDLLTRGAYREAIERFREAASRDPLVVDPATRMKQAEEGIALLRQGRIADALERLRSAAATGQTPGDGRGRSEVLRALAIAYRLDDQYDRSLETFRSAIQARPDDERSWTGLADALTALGRLEEAETALKQAIQAVPASGQSHYKLGRLYQAVPRYPESARELEQAVDANPLIGQDALFDMIGSIRVIELNLEAAAAAFARRVDVNPNNPDAHQKLGDVYLRQGRRDEALAEFLTVLLLAPKRAQAYAGIAQLQVRFAAHAEAADAARQALEIDPTHKEARYALATSLLRLGRTEEGQKELQAFQRLQEEAAAATRRRYELDAIRRDSAVSLAKGDYASAVQLFSRAVTYEPDSARSNVDLGLALAKAGRQQEAIAPLEKALQLGAEPDVYLRLADVFTALGRQEDAQRYTTAYNAITERMKLERIRVLAGLP